MPLTLNLQRMRTTLCVALVLIAHPVVPVFVQVVAGIVAQVAVVPAAIVVVVVAMAHVVADVMVPAQVDVLILAVPLVGVTDVRVIVLRLVVWIAPVDVAVVLLHVEAAPEFAEMVVGITAAVIAVVVPLAKINYLFSLDFAVYFHKVVTTGKAEREQIWNDLVESNLLNYRFD